MPINIPLGTLVTDKEGTRWVYVGSGRRKPFYTSGVYHCFIRAQAEKLQEPVWTYLATSPETLRKKFPDLGALAP